MNLLTLIKQAGVEAVNASNPVNLFYGTIEATAPLRVFVDQRFSLTAEFLIIPECLTPYEVDLTHHHQYTEDGQSRQTTSALQKLVIRKGLQVGDKVILLRMQGGQKFLILEKEASL